jgi:putative transposase
MKDVEIIEAHAMPDHIHMLVKIPPKKCLFRISWVI